MNNENWEEIQEDHREEEEEALYNPPSDFRVTTTQSQNLEEERSYWQDN